MDINVNIKVGRLTKDSEITHTSSGAAILNFTIAVSHMKKKDGTSETSFFQCKAFGKLAENLKPYLTKGKQVSIKGYDKQERWEKDGQQQSRVIIYCEDIELLGGKSNGNSQSEPSVNGAPDYGDYYSYN